MTTDRLHGLNVPEASTGRPQVGHPAGGTLHGQVAEAIRRWPEVIAVGTTGRCLTYAELGVEADRVAADLLRGGLRRGDLVAVAMRKGWEQVVAVLGILFAGGAYLPVDPDLPPLRIAQLLRVGACRQVLTQPELLDTLTGLSAGLVRCVPPSRGSRPAAYRRASPIRPGDLAYVIFTSGSSGAPKGVMMEHGAAASTVRSLRERFEIGPGDAALGVSALSFDPSVFDIFGVLGAGATLVLPDADRSRDPEHWRNLMLRFGVTTWVSVPALFGMLVTHLAALPTPAPALRTVLLGGDWIPAGLVPEARELFAGVRLANVYGPTETAICSTWQVIDDTGSTLSCGTPLPGETILVADARLRPVPAGQVGDVWIGGGSLARGYWRDPVRTAESFVTDPTTGERLYRTGDRGRLLPDGGLQLLGRDDLQVKVNGFRLELGEVEAALRACPGIAEAAVLTTGGTGTGTALVAYVVGDDPDAGQARAYLAARLPAHAVPRSVTVLTALPMNANGKVDRVALAALAARPTQTSRQGGIPPEACIAGNDPAAGHWSPMERQVAAIVAEFTGARSVSRSDRFVDLGGNSLAAIRVVTRLRATYGRDVPVDLPYAEPTVAGMTRALRDAPSAGEATVPVVDGATPVRVCFGQEQVWFLDQLVGGNPAYHAQSAVHLTGDLRVDLVRRALTMVVARHEILRTTFHDRGDGPVQEVHDPPEAVHLPLVDLRQLPGGQRLAVAEEVARREAGHRFDVAAGPLVRWRLIRVTDDLWWLVQTEHHLVHDGWSAGVLWRELQECYLAWVDGRRPELPTLTHQFKDFCAWQRSRYAGERRAQALAYWGQRLDGVRPLDLAIAKVRPPRQTFNGAVVRHQLPGDLYAALRRLSLDDGESLFTTMFAAFALLLSRYAGENDVCVGTWVANRERQEFADLIGMFVTMLALRTEVLPERSFRELVVEVGRSLRGALNHQEAPFDDVVRHLGLPRDPSRNPLVQSCFSFHDSLMPDLRWPGVHGEFVERHNDSAKFDLNVVVVPRAEQRGNVAGPLEGRDTLTLIWEYNTDLFDTDAMARMLGHFEQLLRAAADDPGAPVGALSMLTDGDRLAHELLNAPATAGTVERGDLLTSFAAQAARTPGHIAVQVGDSRLTYADTWHRCQVVAEALRRSGVQPGDVVGVRVDRTVELPVALLGVLMSGAAYLPLDPTHPAARHTAICRDAGVGMTITDEWLGGLHLAGATGGPAGQAGQAGATGGPAAWPRSGNRPRPEDLAYVLYTSGTTGTPKGVKVPHRALHNLLSSMASRLALTEADRLLAVTTVAFDISALELFLPLTVGATVIVAPAGIAADGPRLDQALRESAATVLQATPMTWRILIESGWQPADGFTALCGGEALPGDLAAVLAVRAARCWNLYGPTETTIWSTAYRLDGGEGPTVPIGRPIDNTVLKVLDGHGMDACIGLPGELYIGGAGVALGYTDRDLSARSFVTLPGTADRFYRTGDLVRLDPDGSLLFHGRNDRQLKLRGFRIEPAEVERVVRAHPDIEDCAVDLAGQPSRLVAYVVPRTSLRRGDLRRYLGERLPAYLVPATVVEVPRLPWSASGKLDRAALPQPTGQPVSQVAAIRPPPSTGVEAALQRIWSEVLNGAPVGVDDDFFSLGGHSLLALRLASRIRAELGKPATVEVVFGHPTVREMAEALRQM